MSHISCIRVNAEKDASQKGNKQQSPSVCDTVSFTAVALVQMVTLQYDFMTHSL